MLQMVKLKLLDSTGSSLESIDLGTMVTLKIGLNKILGERLRWIISGGQNLTPGEVKKACPLRPD